MVSVGDDEETQVLEMDSPSAGTGFNDALNDGGPGHGVSTMPLDDTLLHEDLIETDLVREAPVLDGETQALEDLDCVVADGHGETNIWDETQVIDGFEETALVDNDDEDTERTVLLSDDDGLSDDGATPGGVNHCGDERKEKRTTSSNHCSSDQGKKEYVVDSDASTDEDSCTGGHVSSASPVSRGSCKSNPGSVRSFTAIRSASLRSSGLAAARSSTPKTTDIERNNSESSRKEDSAAVAQPGAEGIMIDISSHSTRDLKLSVMKSSELDLDHEIECRDEPKSRINKTRRRKLFNDMTPSGMDDTTDKIDNIIGKVESPCSLVSDYAVAGLSYVVSQEPGDLSQANALHAVDKYISVNDVGSSEEVHHAKTHEVKSPPVLSAKGTQLLVKRTENRSPVGKTATFDWIDNLEDEGGGDFFSRRKDYFFEGRGGARKSRSQPPKPMHLSSRVNKSTVDQSGEKDGQNLKNFPKIPALSHSDSRLMQPSSIKSKKVHISERKTKKNLFKHIEEQSNSKSLEQQLEATDVGEAVHGMYEVGPDTQMAAEAMEALVHGPPVNHELGEDAHLVAGNWTEDSSRGVTVKKASSKHMPLRKRASSTPDSEGIATRSKKSKMLCTKLSTGSISSKNHSSISRVKNNLEDTTEKAKAKREKRKLEGHINSSSVNGNQSSKFSNRGKACGIEDGTLVKEVHKCYSSPTSNNQFSSSKALFLGEHHVNVTPVAHRTRQSKAVNLSKSTETSSSDYGKAITGKMNVSGPRAIEGEGRFVADGSGPLRAKRKGSILGSNQIGKLERITPSHPEVREIEGLYEEELKISLTKDTFPKRRRTGRNTSGNSNIDANRKNPSLSVDRAPEIIVQSSTLRESNTAKQKTKSNCTHLPSQIDGMPSDSERLSIASGVRTRSSVNLPSFRSYTGKDSNERSTRKVLYEAGSPKATNNCSTAVMSQSIPPKEVGLPMQGAVSLCHVGDAEENAKLKELPKEKTGSACTTPLKEINAVSPVCMAQDNRSTTCKKGVLRSSIARELIRLEATEAAPTRMLKDLRRRKDMASVRVLFSNHLDEDIIKQQKKILARLGVPIASTISDATHFITDKFVRTRNMLEAMATGKPVVTPMWLESCVQASCFIDEKKYILRDPKKEKEIGFSMPVSLAHACQYPLLEGKRVFITPNAKPDRELIAGLVKAAHGQPMERIGRSAIKEDKIPDDLLVLSCEEDYAICTPLLEKGSGVFSSELLLNGIVIQKLEYERHRLFLDHVKRTRSTIWLRREDGNQFIPVTKNA